jgi:hypothetical protein
MIPPGRRQKKYTNLLLFAAFALDLHAFALVEDGMDDTRIRGETDSWRWCTERDGIHGTVKWRDLVQLLSALRRACITSV